MPALAAWPKPSPISRSAKITHSFWPQWRYTMSITSETLFLVSCLLISSNGTLGCFGRICAIIIRPGVVTTTSRTGLPPASIVS